MPFAGGQRVQSSFIFHGPPVVKSRETIAPRHNRVQVEQDQCWDILRQRHTLRGVGLDQDEVEVRPPQVVENYEQGGFVLSPLVALFSARE